MIIICFSWLLTPVFTSVFRIFFYHCFPVILNCIEKDGDQYTIYIIHTRTQILLLINNKRNEIYKKIQITKYTVGVFFLKLYTVTNISNIFVYIK